MDNTTLHSEQNDTATVKFSGPKQVLIAARMLIEKPKSWGKGRRRYTRPMNTCCAAEAIEECGPGTDLRARQLAYCALRIAAGLRQKDQIIHWNDAPERAHAEVLAAFDKAIEAAP